MKLLLYKINISCTQPNRTRFIEADIIIKASDDEDASNRATDIAEIWREHGAPYATVNSCYRLK
jgi:hypothetical protein